MAESVVSSAVKWIANLLVQEAKSLDEVRGQVELLLAELRQMQRFLKNADAKQDENQAIGDLFADIREVAYEAENVIASFLFKVEEPRRRKGLGNFLRRSVCIFGELIDRHSIGSEINSITAKITRLKTDLRTFGIIAISQGSSSTVQQRQPLLRRTYSHVVEEDFVGCEADMKILLSHLVGEEAKDHRAISICGMGGLGKTTLAKKVYHHKDVRSHFDAFAWVSISQAWQLKDVLQRILTKLLPHENDTIANVIEDQLVKKLYQVQLEKKCLVVLDDIWSPEAWVSLSPAFPTGGVENNGSKIILTTRNKEVAAVVGQGVFLHEPKCLTEEESRKLFEEKAFSKDFKVDDTLMNLGMKVVEKCKGLPLAIVVLGGLLRTKHNLGEWQRVHESIDSYLKRTKFIGGQVGTVFDVLALSYQDLPYHLKACFLHLGNFPEDFKIEAETLYQLWMAEGFVSQEERGDKETMMDVAERYLGELAQRCMVQVESEDEKYYSPIRGSRRFHHCQLHDLMRYLCLSKGKEENFLKVMIKNERMHPSSSSMEPSGSINGSTTHRLAIHQAATFEQVEQIRAVSFFMDDKFNYQAENELRCFSKNSKFLRVIHFEGVGLSWNNRPTELPKERQGSSSTVQRQPLVRRTYSHVVEEDFVGCEPDIKILLSHLAGEEAKDHRAISICGMGGLGKTTLAKKVYHHKDVRSHFDAFAWVSISQQWQLKDVLQRILTKLLPHESGTIVNMIEDQLVKQLYQVQLEKQCLVILDDIWSLDAWVSLSQAFPMGNKGSKIILTTRNKNVAAFVDQGGFLHEPKCLTKEESWKLFEKKAFPKTDFTDFKVDERLKNLGMKMVEECKGLPLAIVVLGGLLRTKHTLGEWQIVHQRIDSLLKRGKFIGGQESAVLLDVLALSYQDLPYHLKNCFLYLGLFPKDFEIEAETLYQFWMAEGFVSQEERGNKETMMDVAERYLGELAQRCMVQVEFEPEEDYSSIRGSRRFHHCQLHDLMRDLCLSKGKEECPRLGNELRCFSKNSNFFRWSSNDSRTEVPKEIGNLIHLRYLGLRGTSFTKLPSSIGKLRYLQTLDLRTRFTISIPNVLWKMEGLIHIYFPDKFSIKGGRQLRLDRLSKLETIENLDPNKVDVGGFSKLTNLQRLKEVRIWKKLEGLVVLFNNCLLDSKHQLQYISIAIFSCDFRSVEELSLLRMLLCCDCLVKLRIEGFISKLPECEFGPSLTTLTLRDSQLNEDPMATLEKLPNLRFLMLERNAFVGKEMVCSAHGFLHLQYLRLGDLETLEEWKVDDGAMPNLSSLEIDGCKNLKMVPDGLRFISTLEELRICAMPIAFQDRLRVIDGEGEDFQKIRHIPSIKFMECSW